MFAQSAQCPALACAIGSDEKNAVLFGYTLQPVKAHVIELLSSDGLCCALVTSSVCSGLLVRANATRKSFTSTIPSRIYNIKGKFIHGPRRADEQNSDQFVVRLRQVDALILVSVEVRDSSWVLILRRSRDYFNLERGSGGGNFRMFGVRTHRRSRHGDDGD